MPWRARKHQRLFLSSSFMVSPPRNPSCLASVQPASWTAHTHQAQARAARAPQQYYYSRLPRCTLTIFFQRNTSSPFFSFAFSVKKQQLRTNSQQFDKIFWTVKRRCAKNFVLCISCLPPKG